MFHLHIGCKSSSLHRQHFSYRIYFISYTNSLLCENATWIHESSCIWRVREEGGEGKTVGTCATSQGGGGKKRNRAVCLLLIYRGARSLFRYYGLSTSFSTCTDCELHSSSPPANQFNDFIRPPSPSRTREIEISCFKGKCERLWKCFGCKKRKIALSNCFLRSIWKYNIFVI